MDPITHGLAGALIAEAGFSQKLGGRSRYLLAGAAMFPDIDIIYRIEGLPTYIANHRALTHSFIGLIFSGAILGAVFGKLDEERRYIPWIAACWVALFSHQILDLITSYGTVVLYPFSKTRFYFDWVFILDGFLTGTFLIALIAARLKPERSERRAKIGLLILSGYIAFCALNHTLAMHQLKIAAEKGALTNVDAKLALLEAYTFTENRPGDAAAIARELQSKYPGNQTFARYLLKIYADLKNRAELTKTARQILVRVKEGKPNFSAFMKAEAERALAEASKM